MRYVCFVGDLAKRLTGVPVGLFALSFMAHELKN
jgi:hypothetical protein